MSLVLLKSRGGSPQGSVSGVSVTRTLAVGALTGLIALSGVALTRTVAVGQELGTESDSGVALVRTLATGALSGAGALSGGALVRTLGVGALSGAAPVSGVALPRTLAAGALAGDGPLSGVAMGRTLAIGDALDGSAPAPVLAAQSAGTRLLYTQLERRIMERRVEQEQRQQAQQIALTNAKADAVQAEIAQRLHAELARQEELNELQRLRVLVSRHSELLGVPESVQRAFLRARAEASFSRLQALQREFAKSLDEEELALLMILLEEG